MIIGIMLMIFAFIMFGIGRSIKAANGKLYRAATDETFQAAGFVSLIAGILAMIAVSIAYPTSCGTVTDLEAFYEDTSSVYEEAIEKYKGEAVVVQTYDGSNSYKTYPGIYTEKIEWYNENLMYYRKWQDNWFIGDFISKVPDHLEPIRGMPGIG